MEVVFFGTTPLSAPLDAMDYALYGAYRSWYRVLSSRGEYDLDPEMSIAKNVLGARDLLPVSIHAVVSESLRDAMVTACAQLRFRPVPVSHWYAYPWQLGHDAFDSASQACGRTGVQSVDELVMCLASKYHAPNPGVRYWQPAIPLAVELHKGAEGRGETLIRVPIQVGAQPSLIDREYVMAKSWITTWKLIRHACYISVPEIFAVVEPHMREPFWWHKLVNLDMFS